jgi:hypothetical protein
LHSDHWRAASGYVALSRHRDSVNLFAAKKAEPWVMAEGGADALNPKQRARAELAYAAWSEAKPTLAAKYGFADYVGYVQRQWQDEKRLNPLDRLAQQMGRIEERRAASEFVQGAKEPTQPGRRPPLSIVAGIVGDYLKLCYDPAQDWLRWVAEDLRHRAAGRRSLSATAQRGEDAVHTAGQGLGVADADRVRRDALPELPGGLDPQRRGGGGTHSLPSGSRADPTGHDRLRQVREAGRPAGGVTPPPDRAAEVTKPLRGKALFAADLAEAKASVASRGPIRNDSREVSRGRDRPRGRDR